MRCVVRIAAFRLRSIRVGNRFQSSSSKPTIDVSGFIAANYTPYTGDGSFLQGPTKRTLSLLETLKPLYKLEHEKGVLDVDVSTPSSIIAFPPGYIDEKLELIKGLQTDKPLKRSIKPAGGVNIVKTALESYGYTLDPAVARTYSPAVRKTHNAGVFDVYTPEMKLARKSGILSGLPDGYGRGRIIGDYRRVALYGVDALIAAKHEDLKHLGGSMTEEVIRLREEVREQVRALEELKAMAAGYGDDVSRPARTAREAVQWLYYAYLGSVKEQDGAAMSLGRIDAFLDVYFERDLASGALTEQAAQELVDDLVIKLRIVRHLRTPEYNALFAGDPTWVTASLGGMDAASGRPLVTKTTFRILHTLYTLGPSPEPNITVLWSARLPEAFKRFSSRVAVDTSSIQFENDDLMGAVFNSSDYAIACCVSGMRVGKDMQFFGARTNLPKLLLYTLNGGRDEMSGEQVGPKFPPLRTGAGPLDFDEVFERYVGEGMDWLVNLYCNTMNVIHYMHDKYNYERLQLALHDTDVRRLLAFGISGLSVASDSLSAIKHAKVTPVLDARGIATEFKVEGDYPKYGNDDPRVDGIARELVVRFSEKLQKQRTYRGSQPTLSVLTITSNVVYGRATGGTPCGRRAGEPYGPGANAFMYRERSGALAALGTISKLPYAACLDGISNTFSVVPSVLGKTPEAREENLASILDGYFRAGGHHINVNVFDKDLFLEASRHPENFPNLTVRISGYACHWRSLTEQQKAEFLTRTFHGSM